MRSVPLEELIKLDAYPIRGLVGRLLQDKTTRKNIMFASDSYADYGAGYRDDSQMTEGVLLGFDSCDIQPRVYKAAAEQTERTRKRAEVFTPAWIVNQMNNHCDAEWFGRPDVFNHQEGQEWTVSTEPVTFPEGKDWKQYVDSRRLEITCGEAPYIVSRYDTSTGEIIPIERRIGILDRKLRIVNENAADEAEWFKWAFRAFQSVYGYEYQGDSLLIARMNLLYTLADYIEAKWHRQATRKELEKFLNVICWNFWQMDGMNDTPPYGIPTDEVVQLSLFENDETTDDEIIYCKIYDWRTDISKLFKGLKKRGKGMKFDFVIGNPPYQEDTNGAGRQARPVYPLFMDTAINLQPQAIVMITPSRWFTGGMGLDDYRKRMLASKNIRKIIDYTNAKDCFPNISISGGVSIVVWTKSDNESCEFTNITNGNVSSMARKLDEFDTFIRYNSAVSLVHKVQAHCDSFLDSIASSLMPYGLNTNVRGQKEPADGLLKLYSSNDTTYIPKNMITKGNDTVNTYRVMISKTSAEHAGEPGRDGRFRVIPSSMRVISPNEVCTHSYFVIGNWNNKTEAENCVKYMKTQFVRSLMLVCISGFGLSKITLPFVPLQDFTPTSDIDWSKPVADIDQQLYKKYGLTPDEIKFIETHVKEME